MVWPDMVMVWKNDRNVGDFKLYRHRSFEEAVRVVQRVNSCF